MLPRVVTTIIDWVEVVEKFGVELEERRSSTWVFLRTWKKEKFYPVAMRVIDHFHCDVGSELVILEQIRCVFACEASLLSHYGGSYNFIDCCKEY